MVKDLKLGAKVVLDEIIISCQVLLGVAVSKKYWLAGFDCFTLSLEAIVGVQAFDNPYCVVGVF